MKKHILLSTIIVLVTLGFSSCNNNKKDIDDLQKKIQAQQAQIDNLNSQQDQFQQSASPLVIDINGNRKFDSASFQYHNVFGLEYKNPEEGNFVAFNGSTYSFFIERFLGLPGKNLAYIQIDNYDPAKGINQSEMTVYLQNFYQQTDTNATLYFQQEGGLNSTKFVNAGVPNNITVTTFDFNSITNDLTIDLTVSATEANPFNTTNNPATVRVQYKGKLNSGNIVNRLGHSGTPN
jgi:outer membrane murein-binding lipoprotein Lpp